MGDDVLGRFMNAVLTATESGQWQETLPPMETACYGASAVSHGDHLLVVGGIISGTIRVYNGSCWARSQLRFTSLFLRSAIFHDHLYLIGGGAQRKGVFSASLDSLIASCQPSDTSQLLSVWRELPDVPDSQCYPAVFGQRLVVIVGGLISPGSAIYAYFPFTRSWEIIGEIPDTSSAPCVITLSSEELIVVANRLAFRISLTSE